MADCNTFSVLTFCTDSYKCSFFPRMTVHWTVHQTSWNYTVVFTRSMHAGHDHALLSISLWSSNSRIHQRTIQWTWLWCLTATSGHDW